MEPRARTVPVRLFCTPLQYESVTLVTAPDVAPIIMAGTARSAIVVPPTPVPVTAAAAAIGIPKAIASGMTSPDVTCFTAWSNPPRAAANPFAKAIVLCQPQANSTPTHNESSGDMGSIRGGTRRPPCRLKEPSFGPSSSPA